MKRHEYGKRVDLYQELALLYDLALGITSILCMQLEAALKVYYKWKFNLYVMFQEQEIRNRSDILKSTAFNSQPVSLILNQTCRAFE